MTTPLATPAPPDGYGPDSEPVVVVIDDDESMRDALVWLIESVGLAVRPYPSADAFLEDPRHVCVGAIVTDMRMPGTSGLGLLEKLRERRTRLPVIVISAFANVRDAVRAMRLGATDVMEKPFNEQDLLDRLQQAITDTRARASACCVSRAARERISRLTDREREVMTMLAQGARSKEIANALDLSVKTVEIHRHNVFSKLEAHTPVDVLRLVQEAGDAAEACPCRAFRPPD